MGAGPVTEQGKKLKGKALAVGGSPVVSLWNLGPQQVYTM